MKMNVGITLQIPQLCGAIKSAHNTTHEQKKNAQTKNAN
jgi:hypothetical protein